ncbi:hypothetical protein BN1708_015007 [Verticillium longisporum]|uniref:Anaphase-promoting complex subunit 4 WD40 domain-containing protein n=1 Tax=Verticillium longisporum TaxID=100787 RepID=A0A0G4M0X4_VERLO|nr:hypothetical protein BN1708_015007 [Verticillium longisporum]
MYTRPPIETAVPTEVLSVSFNNSASHFTLGLDTGYAVFVTETCSPRSIKNVQGPIGLVEMLDLTNYVALVARGTHSHFAQNKVVIWDDQNNKKGMHISLVQPIRGVLLGPLLGQRHVVIVLQDSIRLHTFNKKPEFVTQYETTYNPLGLCCMSDRLLALPGNTSGHVQLVDRAIKTVNIIPAHNSALRALQMSRDGELLATASDKGTLIRIWSTKTRTLHIFDVPHPNLNMAPASDQDGESSTSKDDKGKWGFLGKVPFMPRVFSDTYSFASAMFESREDLVSSMSKPQQGVIGWIDDNTVVVVGAGRDSKWEKFVIRKPHETPDGKRDCVREGWKRCLGGTR